MQLFAQLLRAASKAVRTGTRARLFLGILCLLSSYAGRAFAQGSQAIVVDGSGPWRDDRWISTVGQFTSILTDAGYTVTTVTPENLPSAIASGNVLLAVPSLQSLPFDTLNSIAKYISTWERCENRRRDRALAGAPCNEGIAGRLA